AGAQTGLITNTATLQAASDGSPDNNSFTDAGAVSQPAVDLHVDKIVTSNPQVTPAGYGPTETVTYRISVTNNGIADANNVQLTEAPDPRMTVNSITPSQGSCSGTDCNLGTITPDQAPVTIDVSVTLPGFDTYPSDALMNNTATVSTPGATEINPDDNTASASISTLPWAETSITKTFSPAQPVAGGQVIYTLTIHSDGPGVVDENVLDLVPDALQNPTTSVSGGTGVCQFDPTGAAFGFPGFRLIGCDIPQFGPGEDR